MLKKIIIMLCLLSGAAEAQVSRNRLKQPIYGWSNRIVPIAKYQDSTWASMWFKTDPSINITSTLSVGSSTVNPGAILSISTATGNAVSSIQTNTASGKSQFYMNAATNTVYLSIDVLGASSPTPGAIFKPNCISMDMNADQSLFINASPNGEFVWAVGGVGINSEALRIKSDKTIQINSSFAISTTTIKTTSGDAATINSQSGGFRKDASGSTFTLTNSRVTTSSVIIPVIKSTGITSVNHIGYSTSSGSVTFTFELNGVAAAPNADCDVSFWIIN